MSAGIAPLALVVDDDPGVRRLLATALEGECGLRVETAADGEAGLVRAWELEPQLILVDLAMPRLDGATFCRLLRARPGTEHTPVIGISSCHPADDRARELRAHCAAWVEKPFSLDELLAVVLRCLPPVGEMPDPRSARTVAEVEPGWGPLSRREREVALLVARGMTNREVADALVVEQGTVANHVRRILLKLGLKRRTQLATWVVTGRNPTMAPSAASVTAQL